MQRIRIGRVEEKCHCPQSIREPRVEHCVAVCEQDTPGGEPRPRREPPGEARWAGIPEAEGRGGGGSGSLRGFARRGG